MRQRRVFAAKIGLYGPLKLFERAVFAFLLTLRFNPAGAPPD
jgi:hypothetical protein